MKDKKAESIVGVCEADHSPLWSNTLPEDGCLKGFVRSEVKNLGRQELPTYYRINGAIYLMKIDYSVLEFDLCKEGSYAYVMPSEHSMDIDNELDFLMTEFLLEKKYGTVE